ncbi:MAG: radical SAM protein, partial [Nanoarchaeota archaeon]
MQAYIFEDIDSESVLTKFDESDELKVFFTGCDFNCQYCNVKFLLKFSQERLIDIKDLKKEIEKHVGVKKKIVFTGGEPCLQRQALLNLCRFSKKLGLKVIIDTNGSKPDSLKSILMSDLVDEVRMDLKCAFDESKFEKVTKASTFFINSSQILE